MPSYNQPPDYVGEIQALKRRIEDLERAITRREQQSAEEVPTTHIHDGTGQGSTVIPIASTSPIANGIDSFAAGINAVTGVDATAAVALGDSCVVTEERGIGIGEDVEVNHPYAVVLCAGFESRGANETNMGQNRLWQGCPDTAPDDMHFYAGQLTVWVDGTDLKFRVLRPDLTLLTGTLPLV